jgi:peptidoglycan hydrolase CwlO-like protein
MKPTIRMAAWVFSFMVFWAGLALLPGSARAQTIQCVTLEQKVACQAALTKAEAELKQAQDQLSAAQSQSASLSNDIAVLGAKIKVATADIKAKNLLIQNLGNDIADKQSHINDLEDHISRGKETLADLLRKTNELGQYSLPEVLLSQATVSGFFDNIDTFQSVQEGLGQVFSQLQADQASTTAEKDALDVRRNTEIDARYEIQQQQKSIQADQAQQKQLLSISKGNEKAYSAVVADRQARAAQIRSALFALSGAQAIQFGDALNYADMVYRKTGVRPAFLLAILKQETGIGSNVGTCYLTNVNDGSGLNAKTNAYTANVMKPSRDVPPFLSITSALGLDYKSMPVSCPQSIGFGGGMGPAQFIASTWVLPNLNSRIRQALGIAAMPNPWKPLDAFMAAGIYLSDLGAGSTSYTAQKNAACKYYSGRACGYVSGATAYGNSVIALAYTSANSIQSQIDLLQ